MSSENVLIPRPRYMGRLRSGRGSTDIIKVITGLRRVGKSSLMKLLIDDLVQSGVNRNNILYADFESFEYLEIRTSKTLNDLLLDFIGDSGFFYILLDEIQNVDGWEHSLSALVRTGRCDVYITGSNSKLLSSELATHIAGRYVEIRMLPLSFGEYLQLHPGDKVDRFNQYLRFGALPAINPDDGEIECLSRLDGIYGSVLSRDIFFRAGNINGHMLSSVSRFLFSNIGNETSLESIARALGISNVTIGKYVDLLTEAFVFHHAEKYDVVGKKILRTNGKFYATDLGMRTVALSGAGMGDVSRPLENAVYLELLRRGYSVRVGSYRNREIDFTAVKGDTTEYYQVTTSMLDPSTRERELRSFRAIGHNRCYVLTLDAFGLGTDDGIEIVNVIDWMLSE